jgi:uncharacterized zinc-type alcohol dehydrogenase-like protein
MPKPSHREKLLEAGFEVASSRDPGAIKKLAGTFDLVLVTANARLDWDSLLGALAPNGRLHLVGGVLEPIPVGAFVLIGGQKSISGSPVGSPVGIATMLDFATRHRVTPQTEHFPMSHVNEAVERFTAATSDGDLNRWWPSISSASPTAESPSIGMSCRRRCRRRRAPTATVC